MSFLEWCNGLVDCRVLGMETHPLTEVCDSSMHE